METPRAPRAVIVGSGLAGLECGERLASAGWEVEILSPGRPGHDGATHRVHALAPWILLSAPWVRGDAPERFLADLKRRGGGAEREGLAEVFAAEAHPAARRLVETLGLEPLGGGPVLLPGDDVPRGMRFLPRGRGPLLAPLIARCTRAGASLRGHSLAVGLLVGGGCVTGVVALDRVRQARVTYTADAVVLACGGPGAVFPVSTQPRWCRGSALALASPAGALLHRPELTQAIPVTATRPWYFPTSAALVAGTVRADGEALAPVPDLEAATRQIAGALQRGATVRLDLSEGGEPLVPERIRRLATPQMAGGVPLTLALHHGVGGVAIDTWGRTSLPRLYACGEAAGGVQGRRRTMGTGLVEAAVFAARAASAVCRDVGHRHPTGEGEEVGPQIPADARSLESRLDELMGPLVALRGAAAVEAALHELAGWPTVAAVDGDEAGVLAGVRLRAALEILGGETGRGPGEAARPAERVRRDGVGD